MPGALKILCSIFLVLYVESVLPVCEVSVRTVNFGCHLDWQCPDATRNTKYTVQRLHSASWKNVSGCVQISRHSCDLSDVFTNLNGFNLVRLSSAELNWTSETQLCDVINDVAATLSPPSINISMENGSLWVMVNFPCAPSISCRFEDESEDESEEEVETLCFCSLSPFSFSVTVKLYNKHKPSDIQIRSAQVIDERTFREEFGFVISGQVYCAVANITFEDRVSSPPSPPQCISIPAKIESLVIVILCAVLIILGIVFFLLWIWCSSPDPPLPKSLALLYELEIQNATFIDSSKTTPDQRSFESDRISFVYTMDMDNQSYYHCSQSLGSGYYKNTIVHDPDCSEGSSGGLETDRTHSFELFQTAHLILERGEMYPYQDECEILNIPLNSVRVKCIEQEETTIDGPEHARGKMITSE